MSIHTCSYYCNRPECVRAQRDELRQKLEQAEKQEPVIGTKTWFEDGKVVTKPLYPSDIYEDPQPEQEFVTQYSDIVSDVGLDPRNIAPVHAIDISQKRVDETAKDRHEPESNNVEIAAEQSDNYAAFLAGVRFARVNLPATPKREWVGLTKTEFEETVEGLEDLEDCWYAIEAKLKEKNT